VSPTVRRTITARTLTVASWSRFGWLPAADTDPADATHTYEFAWSDPHVNVIAHRSDEIEHTAAGLVCDRFYRHDTHTQVLLPLDVDSVIAVAPRELDFSDVAHLDAVRAFALPPLTGFALLRGTWHWGPFPVGDAPVHLWNLQGKRYAEDNACADLAELLGVTFEIAS
jgi:ureidoglycolate hydrolase